MKRSCESPAPLARSFGSHLLAISASSHRIKELTGDRDRRMLTPSRSFSPASRRQAMIDEFDLDQDGEISLEVSFRRGRDTMQV